jgi:D-alanyl-D-alanine carboxypeptidase (penicillin-binding protein 5/6)
MPRIPALSRQFWHLVATTVILLLCNVNAGAQMPSAPVIAAKNWVLVDLTSGQTLAGLDPAGRVDPASLTKLMTEYLTLEALKDKRLALEQQVPVPANLYKRVNQHQESVMFLPPGKTVTVDELLHGLIIQSGNDAALVLAEAVSGNESTFVDMMNATAKRLGLTGTSYRNAAGLTDPQHYTTPADLAILVEHLINDFPSFYKLYSEKEFTYNGIRQPNRNRLLWIDPSVDGVKTGHTDAAGYCLISSAHRPMASGGERRLLAIVLGTTSDDARQQESLKLLNWGFQDFDAVKLYDANEPVATPEVWKGRVAQVKVGFTRPIYLTVPKGRGAQDVKSVLDHNQPLLAPLRSGERIGTLHLSIDGKPVANLPVVALEDVELAGFFGRVWDSVKLWFKH